MARQEAIKKAEAARRWGVSRPAVAKYVAKGMPVNADGTVPWPRVDEWRKTYNVPEKSGNFRSRQVCSALPVNSSAVDLLRHLYGAGMMRIADVAKALGMSPAQQRAINYIASAWLWSVAGPALSESCPAMDYSGITSLKLSPRQEVESDRLIDKAEAALGMSTEI